MIIVLLLATADGEGVVVVEVPADEGVGPVVPATDELGVAVALAQAVATNIAAITSPMTLFTVLLLLVALRPRRASGVPRRAG